MHWAFVWFCLVFEYYSYALGSSNQVLPYIIGIVFYYYTFHLAIHPSITLFSIINGGESVSCL